MQSGRKIKCSHPMPVATVVLLLTNLLMHVTRGNDDSSCNELVNHPDNCFPGMKATKLQFSGHSVLVMFASIL